MRVFVYEYLSSGVLAGQPAAESLRREGWTMLRAVVEDLTRCPGVKVLTMLDPALAGLLRGSDALAISLCSGPAEEHSTFLRQAHQADAALLIAPEFDDLLCQRCLWAEEFGVALAWSLLRRCPARCGQTGLGSSMAANWCADTANLGVSASRAFSPGGQATPWRRLAGNIPHP